MVRWKIQVYTIVFWLMQSGNSSPKTRMSDPLSINQNTAMDINLLQIPPEQISTIETDVPGEPLGPTDFNQKNTKEGDLPAGVQSRMDPIEIAGLYQGDISLSIIDEVSYLSTAAHTSGRLRNAIINFERRWPNGVIPYVISKSYDVNARAIIAQAIDQFHKVTCIVFKPRVNEVDYVHLLRGDGCSSSVGRIGGAQTVSLGMGCLYVGVILHELMHATGFWHEQSRADRDEYIEIIWENISPGMEFNFKKYNWSEIRNLGVVYDPRSIMHYGPYAFAKDRQKPTIIPHTMDPIGQRERFSELDTYKIVKLYACDVSHTPNITAMAISSKLSDVCLDYNAKCLNWSKSGECEKNPLWMTANCRLSCNLCADGCIDYHKNCTKWASEKECTKNSSYMMLFCRRSCGLCVIIDPKAGCVDHNPYCTKWKSNGLCRTSPIMVKFCPKTCKQCLMS